MPEEAGRIQTLNILLVEDNEADAKITVRAFNRAESKNNLYVVYGGQDALDFIYHLKGYADKERFPSPDIILLDINMPKVNGFQVLEKLKSNSGYSYIPVIVLSSSKNPEDINRSYKLGASGYIPKAVDYEDFVEIVNVFNLYWKIVSRLPRK